MASPHADIDELIDSYLAMVESPDNRARGEKWEPASRAAYYYWQRVPRPAAGPMPLVVLSMNAFYHHAFGLDLRSFYTDPQAYLKGYLTACLNKFHWFQDDTYFLPEVPIWLGPSFEPNLFGKDVLYADDKDPWIGQEPVLRVRQDLDRLEPPDFRRSGLMPVVHRMYEEIGDLLGGRLKVRFTNWLRGPFVLAFHLRGAGNILMDMIDAPAYVHRLMRFITDARKRWSRERAELLGEDIGPGDLYNDEVNVPLLSPKYYREFVLPYEIELSEFYGEIGYWHSCGDTGPLAEVIRTIPHLNMVNISGWTDFDQAAGAYAGSGLPLEANIHPLKDLQQASEDQMRSKVAHIARRRKDLGIKAMFVRVDSLELLHGMKEDIGMAQRWLQVARQAMEDA
jgi:uroporphyrinogen-III decarboxylase